VITEPTAVIRFDVEEPRYRPGESLSGEYWVESPDECKLKAVEVSVLWHTEGKGDEDMAVHEFWRRDEDDGFPVDLSRPERFTTVLPNSPLSYDGQIVKIRWCVRLRAFPFHGKEIFGERSFQLGAVPPPRSTVNTVYSVK
jgi:hypothetical protein